MSRPRVQFPFIAFYLLTSLTDAVMLPSVPAKAHEAKTADARWWAQLGDRVYYAPPASSSFLSLSQNVSDYYYMMGSKSALTKPMKDHVVGSEGRWHIMHLPTGPSMLELSSSSMRGDRRASFSALTQLRSGTVLKSGFPHYHLDASYKHPLDEDGQKVEKEAVSFVKNNTAMDYLSKLVNGFPTRSYSNLDQSARVEEFLKKEFEDMGLQACFHSFKDGYGPLTNVLAHVPGSGDHGSVIVGAHYDSRPFDGKAPGAEDNGSGVASLLAMAKAFVLSKAKPTKSVYFVAFAGEEPGLIGSRHFADALKQQSLPSECSESGSFIQMAQTIKKRDSRKAEFHAADYHAIVMDEIGWRSPSIPKPTVNLESYDRQGKEVMDHLRSSNDLHNGDSLDVVHNAHPFGSDHMSFLDNGISAALTINGDDESYPNYHQSSDTIKNVDPELLMKITKMNVGGLIRMALS